MYEMRTLICVRWSFLSYNIHHISISLWVQILDEHKIYLFIVYVCILHKIVGLNYIFMVQISGFLVFIIIAIFSVLMILFFFLIIIIEMHNHLLTGKQVTSK